MNFKEIEKEVERENRFNKTVCLIDIPNDFKRSIYQMDRVHNNITHICELLKVKPKYIEDYLNPHTKNIETAKTAIRMNKQPAAVLILADVLHAPDNLTSIYTERDIPVYLYYVDLNQIYTYEEYTKSYNKELKLDQVMFYRMSPKREYLEELADAFAPALGWTFSGPIHEQSAEAELLSSLKYYDLLPSAGYKNSSASFANTVRKVGDTFMEEDIAPSGKIQVKMSRKKLAEMGRAVPTSELKAFERYLKALIKSDLLSTMLIDGYMLCSCGHPVRTTGSTYEDAYCPYCDKAIPNFEVFTFDALAYQGYLTYSRVNED